MIERTFCRHPFITFAAGMVFSAILALPFAFAAWHWFILPGLLKQIEVIEGTKLVRLMAADQGKRKCMESVMLRGKLVCLEQGGK